MEPTPRRDRRELLLAAAFLALCLLLFGERPVVNAAGIIVANLVVLALVYLIVGYGLVPTTVWAARQTFRHLSQVVTLMGRALPFVLVFSAFLFLNAELWQVAQRRSATRTVSWTAASSHSSERRRPTKASRIVDLAASRPSSPWLSRRPCNVT